MPDVEKVIKGLRMMMECYETKCEDCEFSKKTPCKPRFCEFNEETYITDAISLLEAHKKEKPINVRTLSSGITVGVCPFCKSSIVDALYNSFCCGRCGQELEWEVPFTETNVNKEGEK